MIFYPILELYFKLMISLPNFIWGIGIIALFLIGYIGLSEIRNAILAIIGLPMLAYLICYACKEISIIPALTVIGIIFRLMIDLLIIKGIVEVIRLIMGK